MLKGDEDRWKFSGVLVLFQWSFERKWRLKVEEKAAAEGDVWG